MGSPRYIITSMSFQALTGNRFFRCASLLLAPLALAMLARHAVVAPLAFGATFLAAAAFRRVPVLNTVIR
jgi:hypothetical protein